MIFTRETIFKKIVFVIVLDELIASLTLLHSQQPKRHRVLTVLSAKGLKEGYS